MVETLDRKDRDQARLRLGANVVVEAGAGTGKTTLLTDRILFLLLGKDPVLSIGELVALTFTEKAAGEIKLRLSERLGDLVAVLTGGGAQKEDLARATLKDLRASFGKADADLLARARAALEDMDKSQIGTIHAFASHLLRTFPIEARVDPGFAVDEGERFEELFDQEWARWLDAELGEKPLRRDDWLEVLRLIPLEDLEDLARELCRERFELEDLGSGDAELAKRLEEMAAALAHAGKDQPKPAANSRILGSLENVSAHLKVLAAAAGAAELAMPASVKSVEFKASAWPSKWDRSLEASYLQAVDVASASSAEQEALLRRARRLLIPFARAFREAYTRRGLVSFDGLLKKSRDLLRDHPEVREELKRRYAALLIDEFQDTDPLQGELLLFLAEEEGQSASRWREVRLTPGKLFVVGDPKQSIYRFRGADIAAYQGFTEHVLKGEGALSCELKTNFRSPHSILGPVNAVFEKLMIHSPGLQPGYNPLAAASAGTGDREASIRLVSIEPDDSGEKPFDAESVQRAEAAWIARWILAQCGPGKKYRYQDAAVLLRTSTPLGVLLETFKSLAIPYAVEVEKYFYGAQEVLDFLNLLRALDDPGDRVALAGLLRSPLVGLEDAALYRLAREGALGYLKEPPAGLEGRETLKRFFVLLRGLRERVGRVPLGELVRAVLDETALLEVSARAYHEQQSVSNLLKFGRMAAEASEGEGLTLREFIERIGRDIKKARAEGESPLADEHLEAVRVMTVHKAKGLEFPVVFLTNASGGRGRGGGKPVSLLDWGSRQTGWRLSRLGAADAAMAWLEAREAVRQDHETLRLLYVAMTRAKEQLFVLGKNAGDKHSLSSRLASAGAWPAGEPAGDRLELEGKAFFLPVERVKAGAEILTGLKAAAPESPREKLPSPKSFAAAWKKRWERCEEARGSVWIRRPTDYLHEADKRPFVEEEEGSGVRSGTLVGQACHKALEAWNYKSGGDLAAAVSRACRTLERSNPQADWEGVRREAQDILEKFLASAAARELAAVEILGREIPFVYGDSGTVVRGSIDLLYRKSGKVVVADYKTERVTAKDVKGRREKYARQGAAYRAAVEKAWGLKGVGFRLLFLREPQLCEEIEPL